MRNAWQVEHRPLRDKLEVVFNVSIYYALPQSPTDGISIEMYELDGDEVSREDLVDRFGEDSIEMFEVDLAVG